MKFGPEINDALGGRLDGVVYQLPNHCAAILRALLFSRAPNRLYFGAYLSETNENQYVMQFQTEPADKMGDHLNALLQYGYVEERDLSLKLSEKSSVRTHMLRLCPNRCLSLTRKSNGDVLQQRLFKTVAFLPRLLPGMFEQNPLTKTEQELLVAAFQVDRAKIEALLEKLYKDSNLSNEREKRLIQNVISYRLTTSLRRARDEAVNAEQRASSFLQQYMTQSQIAVAQKIVAEEYERRMEATSEDVEDIMAFLESNKAVKVTSDGNTMLLDVTGPLTNFDPDAYRVIRDKSHAHFRGNIVGNREDALLFFDALFLEESIKILVGARYSIDPCVGVIGIKKHAIPGVIPNPHIFYHGCLGQYRGDMQEALAKSDFVGTISLCISSGLSLNIPESPTCGNFIRDITNGSQKAVLLPNGETVSYKKAVAWLKQQKGIEGGEPDGETNPTDGSGD